MNIIYLKFIGKAQKENNRFINFFYRIAEGRETKAILWTASAVKTDKEI